MTELILLATHSSDSTELLEANWRSIVLSRLHNHYAHLWTTELILGCQSHRSAVQSWRYMVI